MKIHLEPELREERLKPAFAVSVGCHTGLFAVVMLWTIIDPPPFQFGDPTGDAGTAISVNVVNGVPLNVPRSRPNPVANPVEHEVPAPKEPPKPAEPEPAPPEDAEALPIEEPKKEPDPVEKRQAPTPPRKSAPETPPNQVPSTTGARASDPVFSGAPNNAPGGVGMTGSNPFGAGYAWYALALQRRLSETWSQTLGQISGTSAEPVVVRFQILYSGRIQAIEVVRSSGNRTLDYSAHRAVSHIDPFRPLPPGIGRRAITVEMYFRLN